MRYICSASLIDASAFPRVFYDSHYTPGPLLSLAICAVSTNSDVFWFIESVSIHRGRHAKVLVRSAFDRGDRATN